jgi:hypothetical protein
MVFTDRLDYMERLAAIEGSAGIETSSDLRDIIEFDDQVKLTCTLDTATGKIELISAVLGNGWDEWAYVR